MRELREHHLTEPLPRRYGPGHRGFEEGMRLHALAVGRGEPAYRDPVTGLTVFTARFLAERGYCCDSGCRHCPWMPR